MKLFLSKLFCLAALLNTAASTAFADEFTPLPKNISEEFRIGNTNKLSGRILFTAEIAGFKRILMFDVDNRITVPVIDGPGNNFFPSWSPDGRNFSFTSDRDGNSEIYVSDFTNGSLTRITNNEVADDNASWSADGSKLVFYSQTSAKDEKLVSNIFSYSFESKKINQITNFKKGKNSTPQLSPDGSMIAFSTNRFWPGWDICVWHKKQKKEECILSGTKSYCRPMWSASGKLLAYSGGSFENVEIGIYNLDSKASKPITSLPGREYDVAWSPSGKELAFASEVEDEVYNIFVDRQLESSSLIASKYSTRYLSWSPVTTIILEAERVKKEAPKKIEEEKLLHPLLDEELDTP